MPEISSFFGIVIAMFYKEHMPPHFHAKYAGRWRASQASNFIGFGMGVPA